MIVISKNRRFLTILGLIIFVFLISQWALIITSARKQDILSVSFAISIAFLMGAIYYFLIQNTIKFNYTINTPGKPNYVLYIVFLIIITYFPFLTDGYFFYDDFWAFTGAKQDFLNCGLQIGRPFHSTFFELFYFMTPSTGFYIKWLSVFMLIIYGLLLFTWLKEKSKDDFISFFLTSVLVLFSGFSDVIGYNTIFSYLPGLISALISLMIFNKIFLCGRGSIFKKTGFLLASIYFLLFSYLLYQLSPLFVFLFLAISVYFNNNKNKSFPLQIILFLIFYFIVTLLYYFIIKGISSLYEVNLISRAEHVNSLADVFEKIRWFISTIIPSVFDRIAASIFGSFEFVEKNYYYFITYSKPFIRSVTITISLSMIIVSFLLLYFRKRNIMEILLLVIFIPLSYFTYLILKENGYLTYYAIPLISLIFFYILTLGLEVRFFISRVFTQRYDKKINQIGKYIMVIIIFVLLIQNNFYIRNGWIAANLEPYQFLKNSLKVKAASTNHIHVYGVITPGQGNIYSAFATNLALKELGYNPNDFIITVSDNDMVISIIQENDFKIMSNKISSEDVDYLLSTYIYDKVYSRFILNKSDISDIGLCKLRTILRKAELIPGNLEHVIMVDLRWVSPNMNENWQIKTTISCDSIISKN